MGILIKKKQVNGSGSATVDTTGHPYAKLMANGGPVHVSFTENGKEVSYTYVGQDHDVKAPVNVTSLRVTAHSSVSWSMFLSNVYISKDQELRISTNSSGGTSIDGDEDVSYIGQATASSANIDGIRMDYGNLSELYAIACRRRTPEACARYVKFRDKLIG